MHQCTERRPRLLEPSSSRPEHRPSSQGSRCSWAQGRAAVDIPAEGEEAGERTPLPGHNPRNCHRRSPGSDPAVDTGAAVVVDTGVPVVADTAVPEAAGIGAAAPAVHTGFAGPAA